MAFAKLRTAWRQRMHAADRARILIAAGFVFGALSHFGWVIAHGDVFYRGPAPAWAVWFWYGLCALDFVIAWLLLARPRPGLALGAGVMAVSLWVNWTQFPTFEYKFNYVLLGLTAFGAIYAAMLPYLWTHMSWRLGARS